MTADPYSRHFISLLQNQQQPQRDKQLVVSLFLKEKEQNEQQQDIAAVHMLQSQLSEDIPHEF